MSGPCRGDTDGGGLEPHDAASAPALPPAPAFPPELPPSLPAIPPFPDAPEPALPVAPTAPPLAADPDAPPSPFVPAVPPSDSLQLGSDGGQSLLRSSKPAMLAQPASATVRIHSCRIGAGLMAIGTASSGQLPAEDQARAIGRDRRDQRG